MARDSISPETDAKERAASSEPSGTRPNPFQDGDASARKRRRTSTAAGSRSRSVDTASSPKGGEADTHPSPSSSSTAASKTEDGTMALDSSSENTPESAPHTPDHAVPPAHVTLSLRNSARRTLDTIPSSPGSPPQSPAPQKEAVASAMADVTPNTTADEDAQLSRSKMASSKMTSPAVEAVDMQQDDGLDAAQVTLTDDPDQIDQDEDDEVCMLLDPAPDFPYQNAVETPTEIMAKLINYIGSDLNVAQHIRTWIDSYLLFVKSAPFAAVMASFRQYRALWFALPDLVWGVPTLRSPNFAILEEILRERLLDFCESFAQLTAHFVHFDLKMLQQSRSPDEVPVKDFISSHYLISLSTLTRRETLRDDKGRALERDDITEIMDRFLAYYAFPPCGTLLLLDRLLQAQIAMMPTTPKIMENFGQICVMASHIVREAGRKLVSVGHIQPSAAALNSRITLGYDMFQTASAALSTAMENHITSLTYSNANQQITALGDLVQICLQTDNPAASAVVQEFCDAHPDIRPEFIPEVYAMRWRFSMFCRLIICSQMQLRVMAVTNLCQELVACWRRYGDHLPDTTRETPVLQLVSDFLASTNVVTYLLGPTCHPEITAESGNIIGFLAVSRTYTNEHADMFWQTVTTTQDPRISEALLRMICRITHLLSYEAAIYLCQKLLVLPISAYNQTMRDFCDALLRHVSGKTLDDRPAFDTVPFAVCLHLLRESSVPGLKAPTAYPELQSFAIDKLNDLLKNVGLEPEQRQILYQSCLSDIRQKSPTTLGSLCAINIINRHFGSRDLAMLTTENNLTELVVNDLEYAIQNGNHLLSPAVISGTTNSPRRDTILQIVVSHAATLTPALSARLWDLMVGPGAACTEDRNASWKVLIACTKRDRLEVNPFLARCFGEFLPTLPPSCFCEGLLEFIQDNLMPQVNDPASILLDEEDTTADRSILEQLWRVVLTAPPETIEIEAINLLVKDVYIESRSILSFPHHRARKVHLALVNRCLRHLSTAAEQLKAFGVDGSSSSAENPQVLEQEAMFVRSLCVLKEFHRLYRTRPYFSTPDLGSYLLSQTPRNIEGEPAQLKYQSFDGDRQTEVKPLSIGLRNTAGSLLASLKEVTGFENYRAFYRGQAFMPQESDICRPLEELRIHDGLILVKRESDPQTPPPQVRPGTSPVDTEILGHFQELWEYLSMETKLAQEIHRFLTALPVEGTFLERFERPAVSHRDIFSIGQPYKSLYAVHGLREFLHMRRKALEAAQAIKAIKATHKAEDDGQMATDGAATKAEDEADAAQAYKEALAIARRLALAAICDPDVVDSLTTIDLQISLCSMLIDTVIFVLRESDGDTSQDGLDETLLERLLDILNVAIDVPSTEASVRLVHLATQVIVCSWAASHPFWDAFRRHASAIQVVNRLLLEDQRPKIRKMTIRWIEDLFQDVRTSGPVQAYEFREFFWPVLEGLIPKAIEHPDRCEDILRVALGLLYQMRESQSAALDTPAFAAKMAKLVLSYTTFENVTQPDVVDYAVNGLLQLLNAIIRTSVGGEFKAWFPVNFANKLFWKHLFPPWQFRAEEEDHGIYSSQTTFPRVVVSPNSRPELLRLIFDLAEADRVQFPVLVQNLDQLVPCDKSDDEEPYHYDLPQQFDRTKALRAPCGYVGLRNLSNTCYLNSLLTQLFMNVEFRRFMMNVEIHEDGNTQKLLFQTRLLFSFMQDSIRRYVDTQQCVASIKTYDDTPIDIHSQMDVDEFYNLLFDRWEAQMVSAETKRALRSFYGGQLVQQVKSKECEHVSERLEPFSAIQCDIKGKATLQESLLAYVDGEIMEGDNKYKCSTCDRHVDAVKRACLKDIPDHLILHLKRFDFNLRTLQRSKINDYFSFPHELDMRPYTIDQLSQPAEAMAPDQFELVGVLVHSGTAESGHYYSYIRERPSSSKEAGWVEFNDDVVTAWDPSLLEASCFGGLDRRPSHFGGDGGIGIDRPYSAYMLFYQRTSSLAREQEALARSKRLSPVRMEVPAAIAEHIRYENTSLVRRHCLYDPQQIPFVLRVLGSGGPCSASHRLENLAMQMALSHLDQVASRSRDLPDFHALLDGLEAVCEGCARCSLAAFEYFDERHDVLRQMIQRSPDMVVRADVGKFVLQTLQKIKEALPERYGLAESDAALSGQMDLDPGNNCVIRGAAYMMQTLWEHIHVSLRSWYETFSFMTSFVQLGRAELGAFLDIDGLRRVVMAISADSSLSMEPQYARMLQAVQRRLPTRPPSYDSMIALADTLLAGMYPDQATTRTREELFVDDNVSRFVLAQRRPIGDLPMTRTELFLIGRSWANGYGNVFVEKVISINQNTAAVDAIIVRLMAAHPAMESKVLATLMANITSDAAASYQQPFLRMAKVFLRHAKTVDPVMQLSKHLAEQCCGLANTDGRYFFEALGELFAEHRGQMVSVHDTDGSRDGMDGMDGMVGVGAIDNADLALLLRGLQLVPVWAPGLLSYYDSTVSNDVEVLLREHVFQYGTTPQFSEAQGGAGRAAAVTTAARLLGVACFKYIKTYFVDRNVQVSAHVVSTFQRVIAQCRPYYTSEDGAKAAEASDAQEAPGAPDASGTQATQDAQDMQDTQDAEGQDDVDELAEEFQALESTVPELLKRLVVDDFEEDASEWNSSHGSSDAGDSLGDVSMQTAADLNDLDMP